ncbi:MAG: undecaprenyl-diphosphate phosphatase [Kiritimatiellia bacterium]
MVEELTYWQATVLAFLQGATEFIPVSSSGHLVLLRQIFGWSDDGGLVFDTVLHTGSLLAILLYFYRDWWRMALGVFRPARADVFYRRLPWLLVAATLPVVLCAPFLKPFLEQASGARNAMTAGLSMIATALWFSFCDRRAPAQDRPYGFRDAILVGLAQIVALLPGASRSGWTTGAGLATGHQRVAAVRFAFYMAVPALLGAVVLQSADIAAGAAGVASPGVLWLGFGVSLLVSLLAIRFCLWFFRAHSFRLFSWYLLLAGVGAILLDIWR